MHTKNKLKTIAFVFVISGTFLSVYFDSPGHSKPEFIGYILFFTGAALSLKTDKKEKVY